MTDTSAAATRATSRVRIPSLFEIFFGKLANWFRQLREWRKKGLLKRAMQARQQARARATRLETLEPRLLLSSDITYGTSISDLALNLTLKFTEVGGADHVQLINNDDASVIADHAIGGDGVINLNITGGQLEDTLIIDFGFGAGAQDSVKPQLNIDFDGADELFPTDLVPFHDLLRVQNTGAVAFVLAGLDIDSSENVEIIGDVSVEGALDIQVIGVDTAQYSSLLELVYANADASITVSGADISAASVNLNASATLNLDSDGFGVSAAQIAIVGAHANASVSVDGGSITTTGGGLTMHATSSVTAHATPESKSDGADTKLDAAVASVTVVSDAYAKVGGSAQLHLSGALDMKAENTVNASAIADGTKGGAGATFGLGLVFTNTEASIGGTASVDGATSISLDADSHNTLDVLAKATPRGASDDGDGDDTTKTRTQKGLADPNSDGDSKDKASTADGDVTLAGAVAIVGFDSDTDAFISSSGKVATSGALTLKASSENTTSAVADGSTTQEIEFDGSTKVDVDAEYIQLGADHGLQTGDKVKYHVPDGGEAIGGLEDDGVYYVKVLSGNKVEIYEDADKAKAESGTDGRVDLKAGATGTKHEFELDASGAGVMVAVGVNVSLADAKAEISGSNVHAKSASLEATLPNNAFTTEAQAGGIL